MLNVDTFGKKKKVSPDFNLRSLNLILVLLKKVYNTV